MIRFKITQDDHTTFTDWMEEPVTHGAGPQTAVVEMTKLRQTYPQAKISIERATAIPRPERKLFRYEIHVKQGAIKVTDDDGEQQRDVSGMVLQSRPFQEIETEQLLAQLKEQFPDAIFTKREVRSG
jgi:hypothetical protein